MVRLKEYISVIEGTAPTIVLQRFDSPNLSQPALSDRQVVQYTADRAGRGWVSQIFVRPSRVLSLLSLIYILWSGSKNIYLNRRDNGLFIFNKSVFCLRKPEAVRKTTAELLLAEW